MATTRTKSDALGYYASDPAGRGGIRGDQELNPLAFIAGNPIGPIVIQHITGGNAVGAGQIRATGTSALAYTAPGDTEGTPVTVSANTSVLLESDTAAMAVRVYRDSVYSAADLGGVMTLDIYGQFNNAVAGPNATEDAEDWYGCYYIHNHSDADITGITVAPMVLGTQRTSDGGQLGGSGAGTITTTGSLADWPAAGWCHVRTNAPATRELVYYSSRTDTALTVPAAGRGLLGTSADAGAGTDTITPVAPVRLWLESTTLGEAQTIADSTTEPSSPTWSFSETVATLEPGEERAVWIHRQIPADATVNTEQASGVTVGYTYDSVAYSHALPGRFRIGDTALELYELYNGADTAPDFASAPLATSATLPFSEPLVNSAVNNYAVRQRNRYNLTSLNTMTEARELDGSANDITNVLTDPVVVSLTAAAGGEAVLVLRYNGSADATPADTFRVYATNDGVDPDTGTDMPTDYSMQPTALATPTNTRRIVLGQYAYGTVVKVIARVYSSTLDNESAGLTVTSLTVDTQAPVQPNWPGLTTGGYTGHGVSGYDSTTYYNGPTNTVGIRIKNGETILFGAAEAFRGVLGNGAEFRTGIEFANVAHSAAGTASPIEVVDASTFYINVNGTRRALVDLSVPRIEAASFDFSATAIALPVIGPTHSTDTETYIQIFNGITGRWTPIVKVDSSGVFTVTQPVLQEVA